VIKCTGLKKDPSGRVVELQAEADLAPAGKKPPKGILNWVAQPKQGQEPTRAEVREEGDLGSDSGWPAMPSRTPRMDSSRPWEVDGDCNTPAGAPCVPDGEAPISPQARIYDYLFRSEDPASSEEWLEDMNQGSLETVTDMYINPALAESKVSNADPQLILVLYICRSGLT